MIINTSNINEARKLIQNSKEKPLIVFAQDLEFNRRILEYGKFDILLFPELLQKKDRLRALDSGFNHVLAKIAAQNKISFGIDLKKIRSSEKKQKAQFIARIIQNIKICRKANCKVALVNCKDKKDAFDFLISLGASTKQAGESFY
jgi:RNase P/RNase MRP subunit p30